LENILHTYFLLTCSPLQKKKASNSLIQKEGGKKEKSSAYKTTINTYKDNPTSEVKK